MTNIDVTLPFIAIRQDVEGDEFERTMGEYLCNPLEDQLVDVEVSTGGFFSDDDGVIASIPKEEKTRYTISSGESFRFTLSTRDEYDEMVVHWSVRYRTSTLGLQDATFGSSKGLADAQHFSDVPVLGGPALVVPRTKY